MRVALLLVSVDLYPRHASYDDQKVSENVVPPACGVHGHQIEPIIVLDVQVN